MKSTIEFDKKVFRKPITDVPPEKLREKKPSEPLVLSKKGFVDDGCYSVKERPKYTLYYSQTTREGFA